MLDWLVDNPVLVQGGVLGAIRFADVLPALLMAGGVVLLLWTRRPEGRIRAPREDGQGAGWARAREATDQMERVVRDSEELAQLLAAQMDRQAQRLEELIAAADARIRRLERLAEEASRPVVREEERTDPLSARVYDLADQGLPTVEIARTLDQQTGKVELILALRKR